MANIKNELNNIKSALYGKDVRSSIHNGIDAINNEVESTTGRQVDLENTFDQLIINAGNSNAEIVDARVKNDGTSYSKLGDRLAAVDSQLEETVSKHEIVVNVKDFGAKGDGISDDTIPIQNAINNTSNNIIYFPAGVYNISDTLVLRSNITLYGQGELSQIKVINYNKKCFYSYNLIENVEIKDLKLVGSAIRKNQYPTECSAINIVNMNNVRIYNCIFTGFNSNIEISKGKLLRIYNNNILDALQFDDTVQDPSGESSTGGYGIVTHQVSDLDIFNNFIKSERHCVYIGRGKSFKDVRIYNNTLYGDNSYKTFQTTYEYVIKIRPGDGNILIDNNIIHNGYGGIIISAGCEGFIEITRNTITQTEEYNYIPKHGNACIHVDAKNGSILKHLSIENNKIINIYNTYINVFTIEKTETLEMKNNKIINCKRLGHYKPPVNARSNVLIENNYFDGTNGLTVFDDDNKNPVNFVYFNNNIFSNNMFTSQVAFGTNTKQNAIGLKNRVLSGYNGNGYEVNVNGFIEVTNDYLRYKNNSEIVYVQSGVYKETSARPSATFYGMMVFDTTLNKPIWKNNDGWVDANGNRV